jgi:hypothetical protein
MKVYTLTILTNNIKLKDMKRYKSPPNIFRVKQTLIGIQLDKLTSQRKPSSDNLQIILPDDDGSVVIVEVVIRGVLPRDHFDELTNFQHEVEGGVHLKQKTNIATTSHSHISQETLIKKVILFNLKILRGRQKRNSNKKVKYFD